MEDQATRLRKLVQKKTSYYDQVKAEGNALDIDTVEKNAYSGARAIAITSGKGGVGKTNLAVNLAIALGKLGNRVIVIDADMGMANVEVLLGASSKKSLMGLVTEDVYLEDVLVRGPYGVSYISGGSGMEHVGDFSLLQRQMLFDKLSACDEWADIILIDTGAGIGKNVLDFLAAADEILLVTTPEPTSLIDGYAVLKSCNQLGADKNINIVVNKVFDAMEANEAAETLRRTADRFLSIPTNYLGFICDDSALTRAVRKQVPVVESFPNSLAAKCIGAIANSIVSGKQEKINLGWKAFLRRIFQADRI